MKVVKNWCEKKWGIINCTVLRPKFENIIRQVLDAYFLRKPKKRRKSHDIS